MTDEELIAKYVRNQLPDAERKSVEARMQTDASFAAEVREYRDLMAAIRESESRELKELLSGLDAEVQSSSSQLTRKKGFPVVRWAAVIGFLLIAGAIGWWLNRAPSGTELYATYYSAHPNTAHPITRSELNPSKYERAFAQYERAEYAAAETAFLQLQTDTSTEELDFYLAMSQMALGKHAEAQQTLIALQPNAVEYDAETRWYRALTHLKQEELASARALLAELQQSHPSFRAEQVQALLSELPSQPE